MKALDALRAVFSAESGLDSSERAVLAVLILRRNSVTGLCCPSQGSIASNTGFNERTVRRALDRLVERAVIARERAFEGRYPFTRYTLHLTTLTTGQSDHRSQSPLDTESTGQNDHRSERPPVTKSPTTGHKVRLTEKVTGKGTNTSYSPEFETAWSTYPKRPNNSKAAAWSAWQKQLKAGTDPEEMTEGVRQYAAYLTAEGTDPRHIMMASRFFGPERNWENDFTIPHRNGGRELLSGQATVQKTRAQIEHEQRRAKQLADLAAAEQEDPII